MMKSNVISVRALDETSGARNLEGVNPTVSSSDEGHESISENQNDEENFSYLNGLYALMIIVICVASNTTHTLIPYHEVFEFPSYWWENIIQFCFFFVAQRMVVPLCWELWLVFKRNDTLSFHFVVEIFGSIFIAMTSIYLIMYLVWTQHVGYNWPMPFWVSICSYLGNFFQLTTIWFLFPRDLRQNIEFRNRLKAYFIYICTWNCIGLAEIFMDTIFIELTKYQMENEVEVQWLMAFVIPIFRAFFEWILPKPFNKALGYKKGWTKLDADVPATFAMETQITDIFTMYVAVRLGSAGRFTAFCILGVEFCLNLFACFRIIRLHQKIGNNSDEERKLWKAEKQSAIISLITAEVIEILIPFAYAMTYATAYYGPNAKIMTGVKSTYFDQMPVTDIQSVLSFLFLMCGVDALGAVFIAILLWLFCKINYVKEYCKIMKNNWITLAIFMSGDIISVSYISN